MPVAKAAAACPPVPKGIHTTAALDFKGTGVNDVKWTATYQVTVPGTSPSSAALLHTHERFALIEALACMLPIVPAPLEPYEPSVEVKDGIVTVTLTESGDLDRFDVTPGGSWASEDTNYGGSDPGDHWKFGLNTPFALGGVFDDVLVTATGLRLEEPSPTPTTAGVGALQWKDVHAGATTPLTFTVRPSFWRQMGLMLQTHGGNGQEFPLDVEALLLSVAIVAVLRRLAPAQGGGAAATEDASHAALRGRLGIAAWLLVVQAAVFTVVDALSEIPGWDFRWNRLAFTVVDAAVVFGALRVVNRPTGRARVVVRAAVGALGVASLLLVSAAISLLSVLSWLAAVVIVVWLTRDVWAAVRGTDAAPRPEWRRWLVVIAVVLAVLRVMEELMDPFGEDGGHVVAPVFGTIVAVGLAVLVAGRARPVPVLLETPDRRALALAAGFVTLEALPDHYLGVGFSAAAPVVVVGVLAVLRQQGGLLTRPEFRPKLEAQGEDLQRLQVRLLDAEERLGVVERNLAGLGGKGYDETHDAMRDRLERRAGGLRSWPLDEPVSVRLERQGFMLGRASIRTAPDTSVPDPLPRAVRPVHLALSLGPSAEPMSTMRRVVRYGLVLALAGAAVQWGQAELGGSLSWEDLSSPSLPSLTYLASVVALWVMPLLILGVAWSVLPGARGSGRAIVAWLPFAAGLAAAWLLPHVLDLAPAGRWLFFASLMLLMLLVAALVTDVVTVRRGRSHDTPTGTVVRIYGFTKLPATLAVVLPLVATGVTVWTQVQKGAITQQAPAQTDSRTSGH